MYFFLFSLFFSFFVSFFFTLYLVPLFVSVANNLNILDHPDGSVKNHAKPIPYLGGIALYAGFLGAISLTFPFENKVFLLLVGTTLLLVIGFIDDLLRINAQQKFFWQLVVTFCFLKSGFYLKEQFFLNNYWGIPLSALWILTVINAFNLIDVMDGLASFVAICSGTLFFVLALLLRADSAAILLAAFLGAAFAFLRYNYPPARIYLGDAGSLFIGGFMAVIPFLYDWGCYNPYGFITPVFVLAVPLFEVALLVLVRTYKKVPFYKPSPDHFSIYLQQKGLSKRSILGVVFIVVAFLGVFSIAFVSGFSLKNTVF